MNPAKVTARSDRGLPDGTLLLHRFLEATAPFHIAFDRALRVTGTGRSLPRLCPGLKPGQRLDEHVTLDRPSDVLTIDTLRDQLGSLLLLKTRATNATLRGELIELVSGGELCFLGSPWVTDISELPSLGLTLADFAVSDPVVDYMLALKVESNARKDAQRLAERLGSAKDALAWNAARQSAVARLGLEAAQTDDLARVLEEVVKTAGDVLEADSVAVYEYDLKRDVVRIRAGCGLGDTPAPITAWQVSEHDSLPGVGDDHRLVITDWDREQGRVSSVLRPAGVRATLAVAISEPGGVFGVLAANFVQPREFQPDEVDTLQAIANLLAGATQRDRAADEIRWRALHDPLTGLPNRTLFIDRLRHAIAQCGRRRRPIAVLFLDIDHFKFVNDSLGHSAGDELLRQTAIRLETAMRTGDTIARFGGDEFLIICEDLVDPVDATDVAQRAIEVLKAPIELAGAPHFLSVSVGIAIACDGRRDAEDLIREADAAMYRAKENGRGGFALYDEVMRARASKRLTIERELRRALERDELRLAYQPIVALPSGWIEGVEALVRWQHPQRGLLSPDEFMPVAEQAGLIVPVGHWVLREALRQAGRWQRDYPGRRLPVAVNLSALEAPHRELVQVVQELLARNCLDPTLLELEITESVLMDPAEASIDRLAALRELGVRILLDDFGTGYSSLAYIKRLPIDALKIDRSFVRDMTVTASDASIVEAIIAMARGLGLGVVAEGVETAQQAQLLNHMGCTRAQGFLFSRPVWAGEIDALLSAAAEPRSAAKAG